MAFVPKLPADRRGPNDYVWDADCGKRMPRTGPRGSEATDKAALSALFEASGGTAWTHTKGWDINPERVTLDGPARYRALGVERKYTKDYATTPRVVSVDCNGLGLAGLLTACGPAIGQLSEVERLQLARSKLAGAVCPQLEWAYTRNLSLLDLSDNRLTGTLPPTLLTLTRLGTSGPPSRRQQHRRAVAPSRRRAVVVAVASSTPAGRRQEQHPRRSRRRRRRRRPLPRSRPPRPPRPSAPPQSFSTSPETRSADRSRRTSGTSCGFGS